MPDPTPPPRGDISDAAEVLAPLGRALISAATWPKDSVLLLPPDVEWDHTTSCVVTWCDPYAEEDPSAAVEGRVFDYALGDDQVQAIISNSAQQRGAPSDQEACLAFLFYDARDALIDWDLIDEQGIPADVQAKALPRPSG